MLDALRKSVGGPVAKIFIGLLVFSFAIWGIGDMFRGAGERDVAQIGNVKISAESFRQLYQERLQQVSRQLGRGLGPDQARSLGIDRQLLAEIVSETVLDEKARALGLAIDEATLVRRIQDNPLFHGPGGRFDSLRFNELIRTAGYTESRYVDSERRLLLRQQIARSLGGELAPPAVLQEALRRYESEERTIEYVTLGADQAGAQASPSEAELLAYFEERKASFRAPEYRALVVVPLTPETLAAATEISDAELRKEFEARRDSYSAPERREVAQIVFTQPGAAEAAASRIAGGAGFEDIVAEQNKKPEEVSLGLVARREILDPAVGDAAFQLAEGEVSKPVKGRFGSVLLRVSRIEPAREPVFEEIAERLRTDIAQGRAHRDLFDHYDRIEDERAGGATLSEAAAKIGVKPVRIEAVDRSGRDAAGSPVEGILAFDRVIEAAFEARIGDETDPVDVGGSGFVWHEVTAITPSRDRSFDEVRERVEARWREEEIGKRLDARATEIRSRLAAGASFAEAAKGLKVETRAELRRGREAEGLSRSALAAIFETGKDQAGVGATGDDTVGRIVFRVTAINVPPAPEAGSPIAAQLTTSMQDDLLVQYVFRLQEEIGVHVNEAALRTAIGAVEN
jgi:peptidyl-prolyl cis-trans isomerase D